MGISVADLGEGRPPLFLDQTEALLAETKLFLGHPPPPLSQGQDDCPPYSRGFFQAPLIIISH